MTLTREEMVTRMHQAKAFKADLVQEFLNEEERKLFERFKNEPEKTYREEIYIQCLGLKNFREFIRKTIIAGEQAERDLAERNK